MDTLRLILINTLKNFPKFDTEERHQGVPNDRKVTTMGIPIVKKYIKKQKYDIFGSRTLNSLNVDCSYGLGRHWASIPWITIYNPQQYISTPSAMKGIYLVYLFSNDLQHVYLSLNMGATRFSKSYQKKHHHKTSTVNNEILSEIKNYAKNLKTELFNLYKNNKDYNYALLHKLDNPITLKDNTYKKDKSKRPEEYENGNILSIKYSLASLKHTDNKTLILNLMHMISVYNDLMYKIMPKNSFTKNDIEYSRAIDLKGTKLSGKPKVYDGSLNDNPGKYKAKYNYKLAKAKYGKSTINHNKRSNKLSKLGDNGEKFVVQCELNKLKRYAPQLATKHNVHQVSATKTRKGNNALGYDVISRNIDGSKLHIEVKTTPVNDLHYPFDISFNEIQFASKFINNKDEKYQSKNYRLYRLYNAKRGNTIKIVKYTPEDIIKMANNPKYNQINSYIFFI